MESYFRTKLGETTFRNKYRHEGCEDWPSLAKTLVEDVCQDKIPKDTKDAITEAIRDFKFIPGGRYLYYAGRTTKYFNNCYLLRAEEDTREDWAELSKKAELCLTTGGGIGVDYSRYRAGGLPLKRTGGVSSGPLSQMLIVNEIGRNVIQGGSRRSAIYASLNHKHGDIERFLHIKNWKDVSVAPSLSLWDIKQHNFNFPAPLDMTNISVNYDTDWLLNYYKTGDVGDIFLENTRQALLTGEPGFSFNFFEKENETLRNACTEVTSSDDSDVCNLGSINLSRIDGINSFADIVELGTIFLLCGTLRADLPYQLVHDVRNKNRRLGLGLMGLHEWLIQKGQKYEVTPELRQWLSVFKGVSDRVSREYSKTLSVSTPVANRAIAPTGTIGIIAGTTTGIEPIYAVAYKRRYLTGGDKWKYQYAIDYVAQIILDETGIDPSTIETSTDLAKDYERRIKFQAEVQDYVDMGISSTINLPSFDDTDGDASRISEFAGVLAKYASRLRGFTCYPDGARGGQPLTEVPYWLARNKLGEEFEERIEYNENCANGICGI